MSGRRQNDTLPLNFSMLWCVVLVCLCVVVVASYLWQECFVSVLTVFCEQGTFFKHTPVVCKRRQAYTIVYKQSPVVCKQGIQGIDEPREGLGVQSRVVGRASSITSTAAHRAPSASSATPFPTRFPNSSDTATLPRCPCCLRPHFFCCPCCLCC